MAKILNNSLYKILSDSGYFEIPIYQRNYSWTEEDCTLFLNDIYDNYMNNKEVCQEELEYYIGNIIIFDLGGNHRIVIDGQQRITTTILILSALRTVIKNQSSSDEKNLWIKEYINQNIQYNNTNSIGYKLKLNNINNSRFLEDIIYDRTSSKPNVYNTNYLAIIKKIQEIKENDEKYEDNIIESLKKTLLVQITIKERDNPNKIFEVINTTGKKLLASDLIKNYIFFYSSKYLKRIEDFSEQYVKIQNLIGKENNIMKFFRYIVPMLGSGFKLQKEGSYKIYEDFKRLFDKSQNYKFSEIDPKNPDDIQVVLQELKKHAFIWNFINKFSSKDKKVDFFYKTFFETFGTYYSLVHQYLFDNIKLDKGTEYYIEEIFMSRILRIINHLIFSLLLLGKEEKNITRGIPNIWPNYKNDVNGEQINFEEWFEKSGKSGFKLFNKKEFRARINSTQVYTSSSKKTKYLLIGLEMFATGWEKDININPKNIEVEHIIPQACDKLTDFWFWAKEENDGNEEKTDEWIIKNLHTLPNLTITVGKLNKEMSNSSFLDKKIFMKNQSAFHLNNQINDYSKWSESELSDRGEKLTKLIVGLLEI